MKRQMEVKNRRKGDNVTLIRLRGLEPDCRCGLRGAYCSCGMGGWQRMEVHELEREVGTYGACRAQRTVVITAPSLDK